jgi:hypothetical protein
MLSERLDFHDMTKLPPPQSLAFVTAVTMDNNIPWPLELLLLYRVFSAEGKMRIERVENDRNDTGSAQDIKTPKRV